MLEEAAAAVVALMVLCLQEIVNIVGYFGQMAHKTGHPMVMAQLVLGVVQLNCLDLAILLLLLLFPVLFQV